MVKLCPVLLVISLVTGLSHAEETWTERVVSDNKRTVISLQFYFHDILGGSSPTAVRVAQSPNTNNSPTSFGAITILDDPLTEGPDPNSKLIGRAQGLYGNTGKDRLSLTMAVSFVFTDGIYNGSSFNVLGRNPVTKAVREVSINGGTGLFRSACGHAVLRTYSINPTIATVGYNVTIWVDGTTLSSRNGGESTGSIPKRS
ncbi:hypothetical protein K2173_010578 [Erythroxylum novogranatense]|uniref:Dirigent protein n=1 Tax=Erythroxylum novogranatense TaxID=1862640 RepID=A0AAV8TFR9_9ROSI|nr:hypothetical protein K2173_010578 [Erythroxylum novogranatense]